MTEYKECVTRGQMIRAWLSVPLVVCLLVLMRFALPVSIQRDFMGWGAPALLLIFALLVDRFVFGPRPK